MQRPNQNATEDASGHPLNFNFNFKCALLSKTARERRTGGKKTEAEAVKLVDRSTDMFDWQQNQPMEGCKLRFNLSLVSLVTSLSGLRPLYPAPHLTAMCKICNVM